MATTAIKLCGLMKEADIMVANEVKPDYIGFIFAKGRKRTVTEETAAKLSSLCDRGIEKVGVFRNNDLKEVVKIAESGIITMIQLHGKEDGDFIKALRERVNLPVIKAYGIAWPEDIEAANESTADFVLLDTPGGGTGFTFDHDLLDGMKRDFFLAGGLDPKNISDIIREFHPYGVDVSSGIETEGNKDPSKIRAFVKAVREAGDS